MWVFVLHFSDKDLAKEYGISFAQLWRSLIWNYFSLRFQNLDGFAAEAKEIFPNAP